ncbi:hypothetical protein HRG_010470 [Hirsutella rhossiliensis]|uniref:Uncharacterized protein n=1 Tax=Hirsutella rhossiliensis TaxID=111463 RepID=A0A9P8MM70_9HYPO|nr:uncharacterized protein HRG_10470 [Hirsutella rhossiliensis]KAH0958783.1 hypothetical protein HRG_10470 [Hirsutella rhossiliensis]
MASPAKIDLSCLSPDKDTDNKDGAAREAKMLDVLSAAVNSAESTDAAAATAATDLDKLYRAEKPDAVEDFLWSLWMLLIATVKKVPADDARQQLLVETVAQLTRKRDDPVKLWGQDTKVWSELPMLGPCMRDAWNLRPKLNGSDQDNDAIREWISLNSFAARMFGQKLQSWVNLAIWELRAALEEQLPEASPTTAKDASLATACEWIMHAGEALHEQGLQTQSLDDMEKRALKPGKLFSSQTSGLSNERWTFWRERLGEVGAGAGSGELKERAQKAVDKMEGLEG